MMRALILIEPRPQRTWPGPWCRRAVTLAELLIGIVIMSVLVLGTVEVVFITAQVAEDTRERGSTGASASRVVEGLVRDLSLATAIIARTNQSIEFVVPDRDGDAAPERIHYVWLGAAGDPLSRQYNGGAEVVVLQDVSKFDLTYKLKTVAQEAPSPNNESAELLLAGYVSVSAGNGYSISSTDWIGQHFQPALPADAISWKVTLVKLEAKTRGQAVGTTLVQLRPATAGRVPQSTVIEEHQMFESSLTNVYSGVEFSFGNVTGLSPGQGLCLVLQHVSDTVSASIRFETTKGLGLVETNDGGSSWTYASVGSLHYEVYGTVTTSGPPPEPVTRPLRAVDISLTAGAGSPTRVETTVRTLNEPELPAP